MKSTLDVQTSKKSRRLALQNYRRPIVPKRLNSRSDVYRRQKLTSVHVRF